MITLRALALHALLCPLVAVLPACGGDDGSTTATSSPGQPCPKALKCLENQVVEFDSCTSTSTPKLDCASLGTKCLQGACVPKSPDSCGGAEGWAVCQGNAPAQIDCNGERHVGPDCGPDAICSNGTCVKKPDDPVPACYDTSMIPFCQGNRIAFLDTCTKAISLGADCGAEATCVNGGCFFEKESSPATPQTPPPDCTPFWVPACLGNGVAVADQSCGLPPKPMGVCSFGCKDGLCLLDSGAQTSAWKWGCIDNDLAMFPPNGAPPQLYKTCPFGCDPLLAKCIDDDPCPNKKAAIGCDTQNLVWLDSCGAEKAIQKKCSFGCTSGQGEAACLPDPGLSQVVKTITVNSLDNLCPNHTTGDKEFKGHGPVVTSSAELSFSKEKLSARVVFDLIETKADWTGARLDTTFDLWSPPVGCSIVALLTAPSSSCQYTDTNHDLFACYPAPNGPVAAFVSNGDTGGNDVGDCTQDDAYLNIKFNPIQVKLECKSP